MVINLIRDTYNAFEGQRGYADQTMRTYRYDAPVCIIGETGFSEPALLDRLCTVSLSRNVSKSFLEHFRSLKALPLENLGRTLLDHALATSADDVTAGIEAELSQVDPKLSDRPRLNAAIIRFGLRTLVRILGGETHISDDEIRSIDQAVIHTTSDEDGPTRKSAVDKILEHMSRMASYNGTESAKDWFVSEDFRLREGLHYSVTKDGNIRIRLPEVYPILRSWTQRTGYTEEIINEATFKKQVKGERYFVSLGKMRIGNSNDSARGVELLLPLLLEQGLFPFLEANHEG
jgi:hypothetical protein